MYNDEKNFYHYSYRKPEEDQPAVNGQPSAGDEQLNRYRNMYQNTAQGSQPQNYGSQPQGYYQSSQPPMPPVQTPKAKKNRGGVKIVAVALVCALLGGAAGAGIMAALNGRQDQNSAIVNVSDRPVEEANRKMMNLSEREFARWQALDREILRRLEAGVIAGIGADSQEAGEIVQLHREWLTISTPTYSPQKHRGIAMLYTCDERFTQYYDRNQAGCAQLLRDAVHHWI